MPETSTVPAPSSTGMQSLQSFRQRYPEYNDLSDSDLVDRLHRTYYSDIPRDQFDTKIGLPRRAPTLVPVDHDPFKNTQQPHVIQFEGRTVHVPGDATDDEVRHVLNSPATVPPAAQPKAPTLVPVDHDPFAASPAPNSTPPSKPARPVERPLLSGLQGAGRAVADTIGLAPDVANMGANALLASADLVSRHLGGPNISYRFPLASDELANAASRVAEDAGMAVLDSSKMSERERLAYNINRFGGQAALTAGALAPVAAARAAQGASRLPSVGDAFVRAYETTPIVAAVGDTAAGAGAGAGLTAAQSAPKEVRDSLGGVTGVLLDLGAMAAGQTAGHTVSGMATRGPGYVVDRAVAGLPARDIPLDPETRLPVSNSTADEAARFVQSQTVDPAAAAASIKSQANDFRNMGAPMPTSGAISNDPKLMALERGNRRLDPAEFAPRDIALRDAAIDNMESVQPQKANPRDATEFIAKTAKARVDASVGDLKAAETSLASAEAGERTIADALRSFAGRGGEASANLDRTITENGLAPAQGKKNTLFRSIDADKSVMRDVTPMVDLASSIERQVAEIPAALQREMIPQQLLSDIKGMAKRTEQRTITSPITDTTGQPITRTETVSTGGKGEISFGSLNDMRAGLASASLAARKAGQYRLAENLDSFRSLIAREGEALAAEGGPAGERARAATDFYRDKFAPVWNRGPGDEATRFRKEFNTDRANRTMTPPTATAGRFLGAGAGAREKSESLSRVIASLPNPRDQQTAAASVREYVMNDLTRTIGSDGKIEPQQLARWLNGPSGWRDALAPFPSLRGEVEGMLSDLQKRSGVRNALVAQVERAGANLQRTKDGIANSALSLVIGREPTKAARAVLESRDPQMAMREIRETIGGNQPAKAAWERAVTDHLVEKITNVDPAGVTSGDRSINYAKLVKALDRYDAPLAELYAGQPEKMNALQRSRKMLEPLAKQSGPATTAGPRGANVADMWKLLEVGLKAHFGILKGGGVLRTLKLAASFSGDEAADAQRLVSRMWFDPELAQHLLIRKVREVGSPAWNAKVGKLLRRVEVGREMQREDN